MSSCSEAAGQIVAPLIVTATGFEPWFNLALEAFLFDRLCAGAYPAILYLWQNDRTVVIGRNQNAWAECLTGKLEAEGGRLARRSSGGGAVYHDLGNLNFSIILPRAAFNLDDSFAMVLDAVTRLGIAAERSGRNDLLAGGRKFSGNAFSLRRQGALHHGTLLVHSEFDRVARYLTAAPTKLKTRGVPSVRSRITNLVALNPAVTVASCRAALEHAFLDRYGQAQAGQVICLTDEPFRSEPRVQELTAQHASWSWRYGETLTFDAEIEACLNWGMLQLGFQVEKGRVRLARAYSDALDSDFIAGLPDRWAGCRFHSADLAAALAGQPEEAGLITPRAQMTADIADLILAQGW
jgi:lipoate-protein ligase A